MQHVWQLASLPTTTTESDRQTVLVDRDLLLGPRRRAVPRPAAVAADALAAEEPRHGRRGRQRLVVVVLAGLDAHPVHKGIQELAEGDLRRCVGPWVGGVRSVCALSWQRRMARTLLSASQSSSANRSSVRNSRAERGTWPLAVAAGDTLCAAAARALSGRAATAASAAVWEADLGDGGTLNPSATLRADRCVAGDIMDSCRMPARRSSLWMTPA